MKLRATTIAIKKLERLPYGEQIEILKKLTVLK